MAAQAGTAIVSVPLDNDDTGGDVTYTATAGTSWTKSTTVGGYFGSNYEYYNTTGDSGTATFTTAIPQSGQYDVYAWWTSSSNRNSAVPIDIVNANGTNQVTVNQQNNGGQWNLLGEYSFNAGANGSVEILTPSNVGPNAAVIANAVMFQLVQAAPIVATAAAAGASPVTGNAITLSVFGAEVLKSESNLTYTWSASGPAAVTYSANGTNAAKRTIATFSQAGSYTFTATILDSSSGLSTTSSVALTVIDTYSGLSVSPAAQTLTGGGTRSSSRPRPWTSLAWPWPRSRQ